MNIVFQNNNLQEYPTYTRNILLAGTEYSSTSIEHASMIAWDLRHRHRIFYAINEIHNGVLILKITVKSLNKMKKDEK